MSQTVVLRILDAALNRASEGLRTVEDFARFVLDDPFLTRELKTLRHDLTAAAAVIPSYERNAARETRRDVGTTISTTRESLRLDPGDVCVANLKRTEQSLRSLEEYGKLVSDEFARQCESLRYRLYTLEKTFDVGQSSRDRLQDVSLCVLLDARNSAVEFKNIAITLVEAGVGMIQLRDKNLDDHALIERARTLVSITRHLSDIARQPPAPPGVSATNGNSAEKPPAEPGAISQLLSRTLVIINDRPDMAAAVHADGVHVGQEDLSVKDARAIVGPHMLVGVSTHNITQARAAVLDGANYLGAGPTFSSTTKSFDQFAGLPFLRQIANEIRLPTFAIGGITAANLADVLATGISRVAVSAAITAAPNPASAANELSGILNHPNPLVV